MLDCGHTSAAPGHEVVKSIHFMQWENKANFSFNLYYEESHPCRRVMSGCSPFSLK